MVRTRIQHIQNPSKKWKRNANLDPPKKIRPCLLQIKLGCYVSTSLGVTIRNLKQSLTKLQLQQRRLHVQNLSSAISLPLVTNSLIIHATNQFKWNSFIIIEWQMYPNSLPLFNFPFLKPIPLHELFGADGIVYYMTC